MLGSVVEPANALIFRAGAGAFERCADSGWIWQSRDVPVSVPVSLPMSSTMLASAPVPVHSFNPAMWQSAGSRDRNGHKHKQ